MAFRRFAPLPNGATSTPTSTRNAPAGDGGWPHSRHPHVGISRPLLSIGTLAAMHVGRGRVGLACVFFGRHTRTSTVLGLVQYLHSYGTCTAREALSPECRVCTYDPDTSRKSRATKGPPCSSGRLNWPAPWQHPRRHLHRPRISATDPTRTVASGTVRARTTRARAIPWWAGLVITHIDLMLQSMAGARRRPARCRW